MKIRDWILAALMVFLPAKAMSDYHAILDLEGKDHVIIKDDKNKEILHSAEKEELSDLLFKTCIEEEREDINNEKYGLYKNMKDLVMGSYKDSRAIVNKMNKIVGGKIPPAAFVFQDLNPKFFVLKEGVNIRNIASNALEKTETTDDKREYDYYNGIYNTLRSVDIQLSATSELIKDVRNSTRLEFLFTNTEIDDIKKDLLRLKITDLEKVSEEKWQEFQDIKKITENKTSDIKKSPEFKKYSSRLEEAKQKVSLHKILSEYKIIYKNPELLKDTVFHVDMYYDSMHGPEKLERANVVLGIEKIKITDLDANIRMWILSDNLNDKKSLEEYYLLSPKSVLIIHPKKTTIDGIFEKSYCALEDKNLGRNWRSDRKDDNQINLENEIKMYAIKEISSAGAKAIGLGGHIITTENLIDFLTESLVAIDKKIDDNEKSVFKEKLRNDYTITEIPIYQSHEKLGQYIGFKLNNTDPKDKIYARVKFSVKRGFMDNVSYGTSDNFILVGRDSDKNEYSYDENSQKLKEYEQQTREDLVMWEFIEDKSKKRSNMLKKLKEERAEVKSESSMNLEKYVEILGDGKVKINGKERLDESIEFGSGAEYNSILNLNDEKQSVFFMLTEGEEHREKAIVYIFTDKKFKEKNPGLAIRMRSTRWPRQQLTYNRCFVNGNLVENLYVTAIQITFGINPFTKEYTGVDEDKKEAKWLYSK